MNTVVLILYAQLSQHSEMCFLWSRGALCRQLYSKEFILDFLCVAVFASESQLWFQGTIIIFAVIWETSRQEDTSLIDTTCKFSLGMNCVWFCAQLSLCSTAVLTSCSISPQLNVSIVIAAGVSRCILVFKTDNDCKNWNPLSGSFLMPY